MKMKIFKTAVAAAVMLSAMPFSATAQTTQSAFPAADTFVTADDDTTAATTTTTAAATTTTVTSSTAAVTTTTVSSDTAVITTTVTSDDADTTTTTTTPAVTYIVRFYDFEEELMGKQTVYDIESIDYTQIDTSVLTSHPDVYTEIGFGTWSTPELQEDGSYAVYALSETAVFNIDDIIAPDRNLYYSRSGRVRLEGLSIPLTITTQKDERGEDGSFISETITEDVADSCYCSPATLEEAFAVGDIAAVSVYSPGEVKPLYTYTIYCKTGYGDVNGDNSVDSSDAAMVLRAYALAQADPENNAPTDEFIKAADVNFDGSADSSDAAALLRYYALHQADSNKDLGDANGIIKYTAS